MLKDVSGKTLRLEISVVEEIVSLDKSMGLEMDDADVNSLVESHRELTMKLLLQEQHHLNAM